ncbi:MAG: hypothetical protein DYG89_48985 [Caldilinea sp. CFX5]|nr:hypothetical protein [Caldilinea sp. CFX5]
MGNEEYIRIIGEDYKSVNAQMQLHHLALHDWGIARGLEVSADGSTITVQPGVAIDQAGRLIVLPTNGYGDRGADPPGGEHSPTKTPVELLTGNLGGDTVYVTVRFSVLPQSVLPGPDTGPADRLEQAPWLRLRTRAELDGDVLANVPFLVLAIAEIDRNGKVVALRDRNPDDNTEQARRRLLGETVTFRRPVVKENAVTTMEAVRVSSNDNTLAVGGALSVTQGILVGGAEVISSRREWKGDKTGLQGDPGRPGPGITQVTVKTGVPGSEATAELEDTAGPDSNKRLKLQIPRGENGANGADGKAGARGPGITEVAVQTGAPGSQATARLESLGTPEGNQRLHLQIPRGEPGSPGSGGASSWKEDSGIVTTQLKVGIGSGALNLTNRTQLTGNATSEHGNGMLRIETPHAFLVLGPANRFWSHFYTNGEAGFYFNKRIGVAGGEISSHNADLSLQTMDDTGAKTRLTISKDSGNVGIGTTTPETALHVIGGRIRLQKRGTNQSIDIRADGSVLDLQSIGAELWINNGNKPPVRITTLHVNTLLYTTIAQESSRMLKENVVDLSAAEAVELISNLAPVRFNYRADEQKTNHLGFIAEDVPAAAATADRKAVSLTPIIAALSKVVCEQQKLLTDLQAEVHRLRSTDAKIDVCGRNLSCANS